MPELGRAIGPNGKERSIVATEISRLRSLARLSPAFEPVRDAQRTFRVLLDAMARPGTVRRLPVAAADAPVHPWLAAVLVTLLDHEVSLAVEPFAGADDVATYARQRTSVPLVPTERADFVVASSETLDAALPERLRQGSLAYPNDSATLIVLVPSLDQTAEQSAANGLTLELAGPGVPAGHGFQLQGIAPALFESREAVAEYPCGIDMILIAPDGDVAALPRSTAIRVADASVGR
jgi:alpha-D-ribose 1-methylphosphonate 5-triphosphate synthase subunit PhnH